MLFTALANEQLFAHLIGHLYKEFNQEVALSFIELLQFKQRVVQDLYGLSATTTSTASSKTSEQPPEAAAAAHSTHFLKLWYPNVPKSIIVYKERAGMNM